jgi:BirA family transcriptional regulator, biotin operon repressor / biotin---[acetyl-CoA-carboxylase] ligase
VAPQLGGTRFRSVRWLTETGSTNSDALALARDGAPEGAVVVADHQTAGRGRRGRSWEAPSGASLLVSVLLRPPAEVAGLAGMAAGVAMGAAVAEVTGGAVEPGLKWPNDLVVGDRKLAGILAEADWPAGTTASGGWRPPGAGERLAVVVGVGINVAWPESLPADLAEIAVALNHLAPAPAVDRADLLVAYLRHLDAVYGELVARGAGPLLDAWRRRSATLGREVRVDLGGSDVEGVAVDVTGEGHLVVEAPGGTRRTLAAGDVVHLRPR